MHSEVLVASELCEHGVRDGSDAHLEACSVIDELSTVLSDGDLHFVRFAEVSRFERLVTLHEYVDHVHRDHCLTPCARNVRVHDCDHCLCTFYCGESCVYRCSERHIAVLVRRTYLYHCDIARECTAAVQLLGLAEEYRDIV